MRHCSSLVTQGVSAVGALTETKARGERPLRRALREMSCWILCTALLGCVSPTIAAASASTGNGATSPLASGLVVPGSPTEAQQAQAAEEAKLSSPQAVAIREESRTKYARLSTEQAAKADQEAFPEVVNEPAGGPPSLAPGQRITGFPADNAMSVDLGEGKHAAIESAQPIALETAPETRVPIDLSLTDAADVFQPATPAVQVRIPKHLASGVALSASGVSLTPLNGGGEPLMGSEGTVAGASVVYANTATDQDTLVKPTTAGFEAGTVLRSAQSPEQLYFRVGMPQGVSLVQAKDGSETVAVMKEGSTIAVVSRPSARDAVGRQVPVSMAVSGGTIALTVKHRTDEYTYPVNVDPTVTDWAYTSGLYNGYDENWLFYNGSGPQYSGGWETPEIRSHDRMIISNNVSSSEGEWAYFYYLTKGASQIYTWHAGQAEGWTNGLETDAQMYIWSEQSNTEKHAEGSPVVLPRKGTIAATVCALAACAAPSTIESGRGTNGAFFEAYTEKSGGFHFTYSAGETSVGIVQYAGPSAAFDATDQLIEGHPNPMYGSQWVNGQSRFEFDATDPGTGVNRLEWKSPNAAGWSNGIGPQIGKCKGGVQCAPCIGPQCTPSDPLPPLAYVGGLPDGEDTIEVTARDGVGMTNTATGTAKIDNSAPHNIALSGLGSGNQIGERAYSLKVQATDGSGSTHSSGIKSIAVAVDGRELGNAAGSCPLGPCTASGEWAINGNEFGAGEHKLKVTATDNIGNAAGEEFTLKVHHAVPVRLGPGSVGPASGEFGVNTKDVSISAPGSSLTVSRSYQSRHLTAGANGPLGPQWSLSVGGQEGITRLSTGSVALTTASGGQTTFMSKVGGGFVAPTGDANLTLSEVKNEKGELTEYVLKNAADSATTRFTSTSGPTGSLWKPTKQEGPLASQTVRSAYQTVLGVTEPKYVLAPEPAGVSSCLTRLEKKETLVTGCRALSFVYAAKTKEGIGANQSEWGEYKGRLKEIKLMAYNPAVGSEKMEEKAVAEYFYDQLGRLRAEWNPQIEHALKVAYGYDVEGHVTAITPPGQESWALTYGTIAGDASPGRLLKVTQAPVSAALWNGKAPERTAAPILTGTPVVGTRMAVSTGTWSNSPIVYGYQWEDCNAEGKECTPIVGATNANYTPAESDVGHALVAEVIAANGGGSVIASSAASKVETVAISEYPLPEGSEPWAIATGPDNNLWFTNYSQASKIGKMTTSGAITEYPLPAKSAPFALAAGPEKENALWFSLLATNKIGKITTAGAITEYALPEKSTPRAIAAGPDNNLWFTDEGTGKIGKITTSGAITEYALPKERKPWAITAGPENALWFTEIGVNTNKIGKITTTGVITEYPLPQSSYPYGITAGPDGGLWFTEFNTSKVGKITTAGAVTEYALPSYSNPYGITVGSDKNLWFSDNNTGKIGRITTTGTITEYATASASPRGIAAGPDGNLWFANYGKHKIGKVNLSPVQGEVMAPQPGWTVEYHVPPTGVGLPTLTSEEVEKWGQTDDPTEAMAIFPPDEPQGWPATKYTRASMTYVDELDRAVNTASPSGAITTTEYNPTNDVVRVLSADNRATALKEGCKSKTECRSAEVSKLLDIESTYNTTGSEPGTELLSTLGAQHVVRLASGAQVEARSHTVYSYNQGAPAEGGPYRLITKATQGAQYSGKEEDVRSTVTSYSGQEGLGWKLRKPTSVTTDPNGLKLTHTIVYEASTGNTIETRMPAGEEKPVEAATYIAQFGSEGAGTGQFKHPGDVVVDSKGNLWVLDKGNNRVEEFNEKGEYQKAFGSEGAGNGQFKGSNGLAVDAKGNVWVIDTGNYRVEEFNGGGEFSKMFGFGVSNGESKFQLCTTSCRAGISGAGSGQFATAQGIAVDLHGDIWVSDTANGRLQEFNEKAEFLRIVGSKGSGAGQIGEPEGIATDAKGNAWVADWSNHRIDEFNEKGEYVQQFGASGNGQLVQPYGIAIDSTNTVWVADNSKDQVEKFNEKGEYMGVFGAKGSGAGQFSFSWPIGVTVDSKGDVWVTDSGDNRVEQWLVGESHAPGSEAAHNTQTIYYTTAANSKYSGCGEHPEWANLPCQIQPTKQPETSGLPNLPVTTTTYNIWNEPEKTTETIGATTRTKTATYDAAGRLKASAISSSVGAALPSVIDEYNKDTGALEKQSTTTEGKTETMTSVYDTRGELTSYTDADENTATYAYDVDGRVEKVGDGKGSQTYTYDPATGLRTTLVDSAAGTFTGTYDVEGNLLTEGYPNGMNANYAYNQIGEPIGLEYLKTTHCSEKCTWFSDSVVPSIHNQWLEQTSTISKQAYTYDAAGRLIQAQNTPAGKGCTTRIYVYDEDTNRTSLTTREPGSEGKCAGEGGTVEKHSYDTADRLTDAGTTYNTFGNTTGLAAGNAGGTELKNTYYTDNQLQSETQNGQTIGYNLDPAGRTRETVMTGKRAEVVVSNYAGPGSSPAWTINTAGEWTRNIPGIDGGLAAVKSNSETPVLQLTNLHGDIIATAYLSETATSLASSADTSEFGVPTTSLPPRYSWLGASVIPTELPSGVLNMGARSYVPQLGRFLQTDPVQGGSANAYAYTFGDPVNASDPSGESTGTPPPWAIEGGQQVAEEAVARRAAEEAAARAEAERKIAEEEAASAAYWAYWDNYTATSEASFWTMWNGEIEAETPEVAWLGTVGMGATSASLFSKGWEWVKKNVKRIIAVSVGAASTVVIGGVTLVSTIGCVGAEAELADEAECWKIATFGAGFTVLAAGTTVKAWYSLKENRP